jgi:hypothetical protein
MLLACLGRALASEAPPVRVEGRAVLWTGGGRGCLIALTNKSESAALAKVQVAVFDAGAERFSVGPVDLAAGQAIVLKRVVQSQTRCGGAHVFYRVSYEWQGVRNETVLSSTEGSAATPVSAIAAPAVGGLIALVSAMAGVLLTHWLTAARERAKDRKEKFNRMEPLFNAFFANWSRSPVPQELQMHFDELQRQVLLDQKIVEFYLQTYQVLADQNAPIERKRDVAGQLEQHMREYLMRWAPGGSA